MKHLKYIFIIITPLLLFAGCNGPTFTQPTRPSVKDSTTINTNYKIPLSVGSKNILVEIADTNETRAQGLSGRKQLDDNQGMLFDFSGTGVTEPSFWMKDMNFDLDLIWIKDGKIISITKNVPAPTNPNNLPTYAPPSAVTQVLEVSSGWSDKFNIKVGDQVK